MSASAISEGRIPFAQLKYSGAADNFTLTTGGTPEAISTGTGVAITEGQGPTDAADKALFTATLSTGLIQCNFTGLVLVMARVEGNANDNASNVELEIFAGAGSATASGLRDEATAFVADAAANKLDMSLSTWGVIAVEDGDDISAKLDSDSDADTFAVREFNLLVIPLHVREA